VNGVVGEVEEAVKGVKDGEERWRDELREIRGEVESVRELVPRVSRFFFLVRALGREGWEVGMTGAATPAPTLWTSAVQMGLPVSSGSLLVKQSRWCAFIDFIR
jgi:hypothetical protein